MYNINNYIISLQRRGINTNRIKDFINTYSENYNNNILNLKYKTFSKFVQRSDPETNIQIRYGSFVPKTIKLIEISNGVFNLSEQNNNNIFYNLELKIKKDIESTLLIPDNLFLKFYIKTNKGIEICSITTNGCKLFCNNKRETYQDDNYMYIPIYLFECIEKKFLDINDYDGNMYLICMANNIELQCKGFRNTNMSINRNYMEYVQSEYNDTVTSKSWNVVNNYITKQNNNIILNIKEKNIVQYYYFCLYNKNDNLPINSLEVNLDDYTIPYESSRLILSNADNFHVACLFPDNDTDLIKKGQIFGINTYCNNGIKNIIKCNTNSIELEDISCLIGLITYDIIIYDNLSITHTKNMSLFL